MGLLRGFEYAKDILIIIGCYRPEVQIKMEAANGRVKKDA